MDDRLQKIYDSVPDVVDGFGIDCPLSYGHCPATYQPHDFLIARVVIESMRGILVSPRDATYMLFTRRTGNTGYKDPHGDGKWHAERHLRTTSSLTGRHICDIVDSMTYAEAYGGDDNGRGPCRIIWKNVTDIKKEMEKS